jgi:HK97 family phage major capsid protein
MATLFEMKKQREEALAKVEAIILAADKRQMTDQESKDSDAAMAEVEALNPQIARIEKVNTLRALAPKGQIVPAVPGRAALKQTSRRILSAEYMNEFVEWAASKGRNVGAHLTEGMDSEGGYTFPTVRGAQYEGSNTAGGYAVPSFVEPQIIPLAPPEMGVYKLATVIPTVADLRFPRKDAHGTAAAKSESGGSNNAFGGADPTLGQFTLSAFMVGHIEDASWELLQDVNQFQAFMNDDILLSIAVLKEGYFVSGSGTGQAQGLLGNVGAGVTCATHAYSDILDSTFDVMGTLNAIYHPNATWFMSRATSIGLRKAQKQANLFEPVFVRVGAQDYLHGYPVEYSSSMPAVAAAASPILFGDFKRGYIIGERGGAGVNVKILDQTKASLGLLEILGYQRVDGRVRRAEAIQTLSLT